MVYYKLYIYWVPFNICYICSIPSMKNISFNGNCWIFPGVLSKIIYMTLRGSQLLGYCVIRIFQVPFLNFVLSADILLYKIIILSAIITKYTRFDVFGVMPNVFSWYIWGQAIHKTSSWNSCDSMIQRNWSYRKILWTYSCSHVCYQRGSQMLSSPMTYLRFLWKLFHTYLEFLWKLFQLINSSIYTYINHWYNW